MSLRDQLDQFRTSQPGVTHLVFGDLSTGMVLFAEADKIVSQEIHDATIPRASEISGAAKSLNDTNNWVIVRSGDGCEIVVSHEASPEEILFLKYHGSAAMATALAAYDLLAGLAEEGA